MRSPRKPRIVTFLAMGAMVGWMSALATGDERARQSEAQIYSGEPLAVWRDRAADLDPKSEYAATLVPALQEIVDDDTAADFVRREFAVLLGRIGQPAAPAVPTLAKLVSDPCEPMLNRVAAVRALGLMGESAAPATSELIDFLFDEQISVTSRQAPVEALARIGSRHPDVLPALIDLFQYSPSADSQLNASDVVALREVAVESFALLQTDADVAVPLLVRAIRNPIESEGIRRKSLTALGRIGANAAVAIPAIAESLEYDPSDAARDEAALALARIGGDGQDVLVRYVSHPDPAIRWRIAVAIADYESPPPTMLAALRRLTSDSDELVRVSTVESLASMKADRDTWLPVAIQLLTSESRQNRMRAMRAILSRQPLDASEVASIECLTEHTHRGTSRVARQLLRKLTQE